MKRLWNSIKFWFWWRFKATEMEKMGYDMFIYGTAIGKVYNQALDNHTKRINPIKFFKE